jgi:hypothetical protein
MYGRQFSSGKPGDATVDAEATADEMRETGHAEQQVSGSIWCQSGSFGADPLAGYYKMCMCIGQSSEGETGAWDQNQDILP